MPDRKPGRRGTSSPLGVPRDLIGPRLTHADFAISAERLAATLIGCVLVRVIDGEMLAGQIIETEAYVGVKDRASHAYGGRRTPRNEMMYARAGTLYVYFTYGMHHCMNVVCGEVDEPVAVLLRATRPLIGLEAMARRRFGSAEASRRERDLCSGPAKLCQALGVDRTINGLDLVRGESMWIAHPGTGLEPIQRRDVRRTPRIGIDSAGAWAARPLRWVVDAREIGR
ncbi:MAG: DNA-3-methyladenine glycosylase [Phycisphaerales bacterium]|nr:DNA-3-methyladenine glycosylase [Phycisphaerales bacterium]